MSYELTDCPCICCMIDYGISAATLSLLASFSSFPLSRALNWASKRSQTCRKHLMSVSLYLCLEPWGASPVQSRVGQGVQGNLRRQHNGWGQILIPSVSWMLHQRETTGWCIMDRNSKAVVKAILISTCKGPCTWKTLYRLIQQLSKSSPLPCRVTVSSSSVMGKLGQSLVTDCVWP